ncbi:MAG: 16S rRNA (adenine(1518)-N(6)/adenine(1519)-N(6))-dimethyltransferase RsmA [Spirochaetaceae bacterium]|nr:16S rRNA (adenine(1518)-N(6)/adenine(1519)-N(6))-dimethyltransferase RsmA [Spirochaetaceae bacterium]
MQAIDYNSIGQIKAVLGSYQANALKRFGQNFLINQTIRQKIINLLNIEAGDELWEIGPGLGAMTSLALQQTAKVTVFEIDHSFIKILESFFGGHNGFKIIAGDVLTTWPAAQAAGPIKLIGNLPYNIAGAIIPLFTAKPISRAAILVQKELGERMLAGPRTKNYASFSVYCRCHFKLKNEGVIGPSAFYPPPNVNSMLLSLVPKQLDGEVSATLQQLTRAAFASRRKTLKNNWGRLPFYNQLRELALPLSFSESGRAEEYPPELYLQLAHALTALKTNGYLTDNK